MNRDEAMNVLIASGKTAEQANAFLDILGSAFARRGWIDGEPLPADQLEDRWDKLSNPPSESEGA